MGHDPLPKDIELLIKVTLFRERQAVLAKAQKELIDKINQMKKGNYDDKRNCNS